MWNNPIGQTPFVLRPAPRPGPTRKTLASVVGATVAAMLFVAIPGHESGRTVEATVEADGTAHVRHVSGPQYLRVYLDLVGVPTACDGITRYQGQPLKRGMTFTEAQCVQMLEDELVKHAEAVMACSPGLALTRGPRLDGARFAAVSLAYNVGPRAFCGSTAAKRFNAGRIREGCDALLMWNKAGGRVVKGLDTRRRRERAVCLGSV